MEAIRILLVDDREDHFIMTRRIFASMKRGKYTVDWVGKYVEALEAILQKNHDVYLIDYHLGADSGIELVREARGNGCQAPMIVFTSSADPDADVEALNAGATDYLTKGRIDPVLLERSVRYAIKHTQQLEALRQSEEALRRSEEQLRLAVDAAAMGTVDWDIDGNQIRYGGAFEGLLNLRSGFAALSFESLLQQVRLEDRATLEEAITSAMVDGTRFAVEVRTAAPQNEERWVAVQGQVYLDAGRAVR
jgi:CheY-like chemotaxis protein